MSYRGVVVKITCRTAMAARRQGAPRVEVFHMGCGLQIIDGLRPWQEPAVNQHQHTKAVSAADAPLPDRVIGVEGWGATRDFPQWRNN